MKAKIDPLFVIFEQHLYNFQDAEIDRKTFIQNVVKEYLSFLRKNQIAIPVHLEPHIAEEIGVQVNTMLVKKIYGCLTLDEYKKKQPKTRKRQAKSRYSKLQKAG